MSSLFTPERPIEQGVSSSLLLDTASAKRRTSFRHTAIKPTPRKVFLYNFLGFMKLLTATGENVARIAEEATVLRVLASFVLCNLILCCNGELLQKYTHKDKKDDDLRGTSRK